MPRIATLKEATSLSDLARLLHFKPRAVAFILYRQPVRTKYRSFRIPKRYGGHRTIHSPVDGLKLLQSRLADLLQDCVAEINAVNHRVDWTAHGFTRGRSIITNARRHRRRRWVFNLDLEDFFPSINFGRVRGFLLKNRDFQLHEPVATAIAQIACHGNSLPQGSPCSPVISNLVGHVLDMHLLKLASSVACTYSRYADDITFSTNRRQFPVDIAAPDTVAATRPHAWLPGHTLSRTIRRSGFRVNPNKTRMLYRNSRQDVTGLVVNDKIGVRREYRHTVRAMVHSLVNTGAFEILGVVQRNGQEILEKRPGTFHQLRGMLGFINSIDEHNEMLARCHSSAAVTKKTSIPSRIKVYQEFLMYSTFYAAKVPVVLCEGQTDNVYLTHAIRSLAREFGDLAEVTPDDKISLRVRLYKYPRSSTSRILGLNDGGSSVLAKFVAAYKRITKRFSGPGLAHPAIVLYDNDSGAKSIRNAVWSTYRKRITGDESFVHVYKNLYLVATPGDDSTIEDFFDDSTKSTVVDGKRFNDEKARSDPDAYYNKAVFARRVIARKPERIDFTGFRTLLQRLVEVIQNHARSFAPPAGE